MLFIIGFLGSKLPSPPAIATTEIFWNDIDDLNSRIHANISIKYNYSDNITAYMFLNNILNSREFIYEDYREIGINTIFGFNYSF